MERMKRVSVIRSTLCRLKTELDKCQDVDFFQLRKLFWPREYLWEEPNFFSAVDLLVMRYVVWCDVSVTVVAGHQGRARAAGGTDVAVEAGAQADGSTHRQVLALHGQCRRIPAWRPGAVIMCVCFEKGDILHSVVRVVTCAEHRVLSTVCGHVLKRYRVQSEVLM